MATERRTLRAVGLRASDTVKAHFVTVRPISPDVVDDYGSLWKADAFDASLRERLPVLCWAHDWADPLGYGVEWEPSERGPLIKFRFSDFDAVPQARRAYAQVREGTITDVSVGFSADGGRRSPTAFEEKKYPGIREVVEKADLAEVSLVLRGAVPGAKVLAVRSAKVLCARLDDGRTVHMEDAVSLARRVVSGEISVGQGQRILDRLAGPVPRSKLDMEVDLALTRTGLLLKELEHRDG